MRRLLPIALTALAALPASASAAFPDDYNPAYGNQGINTIAVPGVSQLSLFLDGVADGAGAFAAGRADVGNQVNALLVKLTPDGKPDPSFSGDGIQTDQFAGKFTVAQAVALQADGKPVIAGSDSTKGIFVARYTAAGALDESFSDDGVVEVLPTPPGEAAPSTAEATGVGVDAAGRVIASGIATQSGRKRGFVQAFSATGEPGPARFIDFVGAGDTDITDMAVAGNLVWVTGSTGGAKHGIARFATDTLAPDAGFGTGGVVTLEGYGTHGEIVLGADGSVTLGVDVSFRYQLSRFTATGAPDPALNARQYNFYDNVTPDFPPGLETYDLKLAADGSYIVGGITGPFPASLLLARIKPDGAIDEAFAPGGSVQIGGAGYANALLPQADGKITVIGGGGGNGNTPMTLQVLGSGDKRLKRLPHITPDAVAPGGSLKCDPGDVGAGATFTAWWPDANDPSTGVLPDEDLVLPVSDSSVGKSYRCTVFPRVDGRAFGPLTSDNTGTVVAKGADTAKSAVRKLKRIKKGKVKLTIRLKKAGTIKVTGKGFSFKKKLGKGTKTLKLKPGKKAKKLTIALTQGTVTTTVTKTIKR